MKIRDPQDFWAGMMFMAFGAAAIFVARNYAFGSAARMGPGYFPTVLGGHEFRLKEVLILALCLSLAAVAIFVYGLHLQFPIFPGQPR